jgi:hypothetical protein
MIVNSWNDIGYMADSYDEPFKVVTKNCIWSVRNRTQNAMRLVRWCRCAAGGIATAMLTEQGEIARSQVRDRITAGEAGEQHLECKRVSGRAGNA